VWILGSRARESAQVGRANEGGDFEADYNSKPATVMEADEAI